MASILDVLAGAGNLLDLPGSSLRDILAGRNPFDQWATPFSGDNRATGRDVLQPFLGANQETGMAGWLDNPMEGFKDIAGFGAEVLLDPLNLIPAGAVSRALRGRKGARSANAAMKAERGGKYGYVNPKVAGRATVESESVEQGQRLLEYSPERPLVHHGTPHDWNASATPEQPYGMFDLDMLNEGEGSTVWGPGGYFAQNEKVPAALGRLMGKDLNVYSLDVPENFTEGMLRAENRYRPHDPETLGQNVFESLTGMPPNRARLEDIQQLLDAGITGMDYPSVAGRGQREYAVWDQNLLSQMRVRMINGERVPINPTTTVQQVEQRLPQAADSLLTSSMNPMALQAEPGYAAPAVAGAVYNALQAVNRHGGIQ